MITQTAYKWLEPKPHKRTEQLGIKGRNILAWNLAAEVLISGASVSEVAARFRLPVEAVQEAVEYYEANKSWIDTENEALISRAGLK